MKNALIILLLFIDFSVFSMDVVVYGKITGGNKHNVQIKIERTDDIVLSQNSAFQYPTNIKLKPNNLGEFNFIVKDVKGFLYSNILTISNKNIYFGIEQGDSLFINYDLEHDSVVFKGLNSEKNYFINYYFNKVYGERFKTFSTHDINNIQTLKKDYNNYILDSLSLESFSKRFNYDEKLYKKLQFVVSNTILNDLLTTKIDNGVLIPYKYLINSFDASNLDLSFDYYYLSTLTLYNGYRSGEILNICNNLNQSIEVSKLYLNDSIRQFQNAYLIGYYMWNCSKDENNIKAEIEKYLMDKNPELLKEMIRTKAKLKGIIK